MEVVVIQMSKYSKFCDMHNIQSGAPFELGGLDVAAEFPYDEAKDIISCAEAIQRIMRWIPNSVVWFDYSKSTPLLYIKRRSSMATFDVSLNENTAVQRLRIIPRYDLVLPGVVIKYEKQHKSNDQ